MAMPLFTSARITSIQFCPASVTFSVLLYRSKCGMQRSAALTASNTATFTTESPAAATAPGGSSVNVRLP